MPAAGTHPLTSPALPPGKVLILLGARVWGGHLTKEFTAAY